MDHNPFFSVVIPTYNRSAIIGKTLQSVFDQTFRNFEIIVVDNCSTDDTQLRLKPLVDTGKIRFIRHEKNYERAASRNTGMKAAQGRFVTFLDSDDIMYPDNLADAFAFADENPLIPVFQNKYELINEQGQSIYQYPFPSLNNPLKAIAEGNFMSCIGGFISEDVYKNFFFDTTEVLQGIEDWEFWMRVIAAHPIGRIDKINSGIVHHRGRSVTTLSLTSYKRKMEYVVSRIETDPGLKSYVQYKKNFQASTYMLSASMANSAGLYGEARAYLKSAFDIKRSLLLSFRFHRILLKSFLKRKSTIDE